MYKNLLPDYNIFLHKNLLPRGKFESWLQAYYITSNPLAAGLKTMPAPAVFSCDWQGGADHRQVHGRTRYTIISRPSH